MPVDPLDRRAARWVAAGLLCVYVLTLGGHHYSVDGVITFESAKAMLFDGSLRLDPPVVWGEVRATASPYGIGMSLAYLPLLVLCLPLFLAKPALQAVPFDPALAHNPALYANLPYLVCSLLNPIITALTAWLLVLLARRCGLSRRWSVVTGLTFGLASPALAYARYDFTQPLAALCLTGAVACLASEPRSPRRLLAAGAWLGFAVLTRTELVLFAGLAVAWLAWVSRDEPLAARARRALWLAGPVLACALSSLLVTHLRGDALGPDIPGGLDLFTAAPAAVLEGAAAQLISPGKGLLVFFPLAALALPGWRSLGTARLGLLLGAFFALALLLYSMFIAWWGGWSWGGRYLFTWLPFFCLGAAAWAAQGPRRWRVYGALAVVSALLALNGILFDPVTFFQGVQDGGLDPDSAAAQWTLRASPIASGWTEPCDLLLVRLTQSEQIVARAGLLGVSSERAADLVWPARAFVGLVVLGLLGGAAFAARKILACLRDADAS